MSSIIPIQPAATIAQTHRDAIAHIQDLAITISLQGERAVNVEYSGNVQTLTVEVRRLSEIEVSNFVAESRHNIELPNPRDVWPQPENALPQLQALARKLEDLLTPPDGGNAA
ncbi:hypothetical protein [Vreelandella sp. EE7]